jgi:hypothetical protein
LKKDEEDLLTVKNNGNTNIKEDYDRLVHDFTFRRPNAISDLQLSYERLNGPCIFYKFTLEERTLLLKEELFKCLSISKRTEFVFSTSEQDKFRMKIEQDNTVLPNLIDLEKIKFVIDHFSLQT